jgi:glycosyltransferase involved in cell wall biosynthesis
MSSNAARTTPPTHILLVTVWLPHYREPIYRAMQEWADWRLTIAADTTSHLPGLALVSPERAQQPVNKGGLRWIPARNTSPVSNAILWQHGVCGLATKREYDVVIFLGQYSSMSTWIGAVLARITGKQVLMWTHGFIKPRKDGWVKRQIRKAFYRLAHKHLIYNHHARLNAIQLGFNPNDLYVVFNSLDYARQLELRNQIDDQARQQVLRRLFTNPDLPTLLWIGRLTSSKRLDMIPTAMHCLEQRGLEVNALFIGDGPERDELIRQAHDLDLDDRVNFYGACHNEEELAPLISACDLCTAPGAIGLTAMHAFAYGTPCLTHDNPEAQGPEFEAIIPGKTGLLYRHNDMEDFVNRIEEWLSQPKSRQAVREACYAIVDTYYNPEYQVRTIAAAVKGTPASALDMGQATFAPPR